MAKDPALLRIPPEIRIMIYEYLLDTGGSQRLAIRNKQEPIGPQGGGRRRTQRSVYHVIERALGKRSRETTYVLEGDVQICTAILAVNQKMREEASHVLYAKHAFHFGDDIEAVAPFMADRTLATMALVQDITIHKRGPMMPIESDSQSWASTCRLLRTLPSLRTLRLVIEGGRPPGQWDGPQELSVSDLRLLYSTRHECLQWVRELAEVRAIGELEISANMRYLPEPKTSATLIFAAFSASIETSLVEFLRSDIGIPTRVAPRPEARQSN